MLLIKYQIIHLVNFKKGLILKQLFLFFDIYCIMKEVNLMEDKIEFRDLKELYNRSKPALYSKLKEIRRLNFNFVTMRDIWNYLVDNVWNNKVNLELHELISDILNADNYKINDFVMQKLDKLKTNEDKKDIVNNLI